MLDMWRVWEPYNSYISAPVKGEERVELLDTLQRAYGVFIRVDKEILLR